MGRHPFVVALFIAHSDVFFHIPHFNGVVHIIAKLPRGNQAHGKCAAGVLTTEYTEHTENWVYCGACPRLFLSS